MTFKDKVRNVIFGKRILDTERSLSEKTVLVTQQHNTIVKLRELNETLQLHLTEKRQQLDAMTGKLNRALKENKAHKLYTKPLRKSTAKRAKKVPA